jgi:hypothetical protein
MKKVRMVVTLKTMLRLESELEVAVAVFRDCHPVNSAMSDGLILKDKLWAERN